MQDSTIFFDSNSSQTEEQSDFKSAKSSRQSEYSESVNSSKNLFASKYVKLIDQSDIKWFTEISKQKDGRESTSVTKEPTKDSNIDNEIKESHKLLSYAPILCPITNCGVQFLPNDVIMHFLNFHYSHRTSIQKVYEKQRLIMTIEPFELNSKETICLGLISYSGKIAERKSPQSFVERKACVEQNLLLHQNFVHLKGDFPILVLASVVSMGDFSDEQYEKNNLDTKDNRISNMLVIWLAAANINFPLASTVTAFDEHRLYSRSVIVGLRSLSEGQNSRELYSSNSEYFSLHMKELSTFADRNMNLKLELVLHEDISIA